MPLLLVSLCSGMWRMSFIEGGFDYWWLDKLFILISAKWSLFWVKVEQLGSFMKQKEMVTYLSPGAPFFKFKLSHAGKNLEWGGVGELGARWLRDKKSASERKERWLCILQLLIILCFWKHEIVDRNFFSWQNAIYLQVECRTEKLMAEVQTWEQFGNNSALSKELEFSRPIRKKEMSRWEGVQRIAIILWKVNPGTFQMKFLSVVKF